MGNISRFTNLRVEPYVIDAVEIGEENPLPIFRSLPQDLNIKCTKSVPMEDRKYLGWQIGYKVLPYRLQDKFNRKLKQKIFESVVLENDFLKATFLPQLGGKLVSLLNKPDNKEILYQNPVIQISSLALRKAWFSGGIEWNLAQHGHHYLTCSPVFAARIIGDEEEPALRLYEWERCKKIAWQIDFHLPPSSNLLFAKVKVVNTNNYEIPMYWWTTMAVPETPKSRVVCPANDILYLDKNIEEGKIGFDYSKIPNVDAIEGKDMTYPLNSFYASSYFFRIPDSQRRWIAVLNKDGEGLIETSTKELSGRKVWFWGNSKSGRHWQQHLSTPSGAGYIEPQAGLAKTQEECLPMPKWAEWTWTEAFGYLKVDNKKVHNENWEIALKGVEEELSKSLTVENMNMIDKKLSVVSSYPIVEILSLGSGWGALERKRLKADSEKDRIPSSMLFPEFSICKEQKKWLHLIEDGCFPYQKPEKMPGDWMIQLEWQERLESSVRNKDGDNWFSWLHLGVMYMENGKPDKAQKAWEMSIKKQRSCWAYRNLAYIEKTKWNLESSASFMLKAWEIAIQDGINEPSIAKECIETLFLAKRYQKANEIYNELPKTLKENEQIMILRAFVALEEGDLETVKNILKWDFAHVEVHIEEKETQLERLWYGIWEKKRAHELGCDVNNKIKQWARSKYPIPDRIDFRGMK